MSIANIGQLSATAASNTDIDGVNIAENCPAANVNNAIRAFAAFIAEGWDDLKGYTTGGNGGAYTLPTTGTHFASEALADIHILAVNFHTANTSTTPTLAVDSLTATTIVDKDGNAIPVGRLQGLHLVRYNGTNFQLLGTLPALVRGTVVTTTGGTSINFTGIPSWARIIHVVFDDTSLSGTDNLLIQIGDSGGLETTGYTSSSSTSNSTAGFLITTGLASRAATGIYTLANITGDVWVGNGIIENEAGNVPAGAGRKALSATLDRVSVTVTGSNTFDATSINIFYM